MATLGAGDIVQVETSAPLKGPVSVRPKPRPIKPSSPAALTEAGEILLRNSSC